MFCGVVYTGETDSLVSVRVFGPKRCLQFCCFWLTLFGVFGFMLVIYKFSYNISENHRNNKAPQWLSVHSFKLAAPSCMDYNY